jgi:hypothetical protein
MYGQCAAMSNEGTPSQASPRQGGGAVALAGESFDVFYAKTSRAAWGLALRITASEEASVRVCEAAYAAACAGGAVTEGEAAFLGRVRSLALAEGGGPPPTMLRSDPRQPSYGEVTAIRAGLATVDPRGRRALDLAYYGGASVAEIAELIGEPEPTVRAALRGALLSLGQAVRQGQEGRP